MEKVTLDAYVPYLLNFTIPGLFGFYLSSASETDLHNQDVYLLPLA